MAGLSSPDALRNQHGDASHRSVTRRTIDVAERRARLAVRHRLAAPATDAVTPATAMVALHSSDPATVYLSTWARAPTLGPEALDQALYDDRSLMRIHAMRRTMWVVPTATVPMFEAAATALVAVRERARLLKLVAEHVEGDVEAWFMRARTGVLDHLRQHPTAYADDLRRAVPELGLRFQYGGGPYVVGPRVLFQMAVEGDIIRTSPRGSWRSSVYRWTLRERWLGDRGETWDERHARAELVRMWLGTFGPGTFDDVVWWTGWGKRVTRTALEDCGAVEVGIDRGPGDEGTGNEGTGDEYTGFVSSDDLLATPAVEPWVALLPGLDPTTMGWKDRDWYLGEHSQRLFDRNGNAGPTVWVDGRVVGGWAQRSDGSIVVETLEPVDSAAVAAITATAGRLEEWLAGHVVIPRFRTPLEKELVG